MLTETGCLFFHCSPEITHNIRFLADQIFGRANFVSHFIWPLKNIAVPERVLANQHNDIILYGKSDLFLPTPSMRPRNYEERKRFSFTDERGRYMVSALDIGLSRPELVYEWQGYKPSKGWRYTKDRLDELNNKGLIHFSENGKPGLKRYLDDNEEIPIGNIWSDINLSNLKSERTGYPWQQPTTLLKRIISIGSQINDTVLDPFCGSGTTLVAAQSLGRKWLGCDREQKAVNISAERLQHDSKVAQGIDYIFESEERLKHIPEIPTEYTAFVTGLEDPISLSSLILQQLQEAQSLRRESQRILRLIKRGEDQVFEMKDAGYWHRYGNRKDPKKVENILETVVGFLNSKGGELLIGVDDKTNEILGLNDDYKAADPQKQNRDGYQLALENKFKNSLRGHCLPLYDIAFPRVEGIELCLISVKSSEVPVFYQGKFFVRKGNRTPCLSTEETVEYIKAHFK